VPAAALAAQVPGDEDVLMVAGFFFVPFLAPLTLTRVSRTAKRRFELGAKVSEK
jgi:hypothetical protein